MSDQRPYAIAHGEVIVVVAPDGVDAAMSAVMARHEDELNVALRPYGIELVDLLQPTWMRIVRFEDVEAFVSMTAAAPAAGEDLRST